MSFEECTTINELMKGYNEQWFIAGGWAIDLYVGKTTRLHEDIEIAVFRKDQLVLKEYLHEWDFQKVMKGGFHSWKNEYLELPVHEIHAENRLIKAKMEILLNETNGDYCRFRRDMRISYPIIDICNFSNNRITY